MTGFAFGPFVWPQAMGLNLEHGMFATYVGVAQLYYLGYKQESDFGHTLKMVPIIQIKGKIFSNQMAADYFTTIILFNSILQHLLNL